MTKVKSSTKIPISFSINRDSAKVMIPFLQKKHDKPKGRLKPLLLLEIEQIRREASREEAQEILRQLDEEDNGVSVDPPVGFMTKEAP